MRRKSLIILMLLIVFLPPFPCFSQGISDYLILKDIASYKLDKPEAVFPGEPPIGGPRTYDGPGIIGATGHFPDHKDVTYEVMYIGGGGLPSPTVQVTQHAGSDSDKWLLHELDAEFRNYYGIPDDSFSIKTIDGQTIFAFGSGGWDYRWLSENKLIMMEYTDLQMKKPQPLEVVRAYLIKHPSSLLPIRLAELRSTEAKTKWIRDEMERRLWLCDKWFLQLQVGKAELNETLESVNKHMKIFLDYREKYYDIKASEEKGILWGYLEKKDGTAMKNKLTEYKNWWNVNRTRPINLP